jgi:hypothetical protein
VSRAPDTAAVDGARVVVRDVLLGGHRLWAAVAGASTALTSGPPPAVTWLPLDDVWLEHWVNGVPGGRPPAPVALTQS